MRGKYGRELMHLTLMRFLLLSYFLTRDSGKFSSLKDLALDDPQTLLPAASPE